MPEWGDYCTTDRLSVYEAPFPLLCFADANLPVLSPSLRRERAVNRCPLARK